MAPKKHKIEIQGGDWKRASSPRAGRRSARAAMAPLPPWILADASVSLVDSIDLEPRARRSAGSGAGLELKLRAADDERFVLALRHPSGALSFHAPSATERPSATKGLSSGEIDQHFRVTVRDSAPASAGAPRRGAQQSGQRRNVLTKALKAFVIKVGEKLVERFLPDLARKGEELLWRSKGLREGLFRMTRADLSAGALPPAAFGDPQARSLLFLHGTFSDAAGAFSDLVQGEFFAQAEAIYQDRIYAFNHFTISKTPEENASELLAALPADGRSFDVVTHSRGGLVLRTLVEGGLPDAERFELGRAVLVASPNEGTPLATTQRWDETVGWLANVLEVFPDNPYTFGPALVAKGLVWIAHRVTGDLPGIAAMDANGPVVQALNGPPGPPAGAYSALVANFQAQGALWRRLLDAGAKLFFAIANDLVVPSEGGWRVDPSGSPQIPGDQIGCYGPGGNLGASAAVHHLNFFAQPETTTFVLKALAGTPQGLRVLNPNLALPRWSSRGGAPGASTGAAASEHPSALLAPPPSLPAPLPTPPFSLPRQAFTDPSEPQTLHLLVLDAAVAHEGETSKHEAQRLLIATYGGARVVEPFLTKGAVAGTRFNGIIKRQKQIEGYLDGKNDALLDDRELIEYGTLLFEALLPGDVRRLYDLAREREQERELNLVFTSMVPWLSDLPWEFCFDPSRSAFLATEELHFVRNVVTAVPAEEIPRRVGPLRILVVAAQPIGAGQLSIAEETAVIRRGFQDLIEAGLATVTILPSATPAAMHEWVTQGSYDVLHFIGHGVYDEERDQGSLLFEDAQGYTQEVDARLLRELLCRRGIRLIFLNACETGKGGRKTDFNRGAGPALVAGGVPAVVANQYMVLDPSATAFAQHFYGALARGASYGVAARESRIAVRYSISGESIDWAVPVVYARDPSDTIVEPSAGPRVQLAPLALARANRRRAQRREGLVRVGVWDVNSAHPLLEPSLRRLNRVQGCFDFTLEHVSAPIGSWGVHKEGEGLVYLHCERVNEQLAKPIGALGLDYLVCLTTFPLSDDDWLNLIAWWDEGPLILFSTYEMDIPRGVEAERALANVLAMALASVSTGVETHARTPKSCPLYFNEEREVEALTQRSRFDATCLKNLRAAGIDEAELAALQEILGAFQA